MGTTTCFPPTCVIIAMYPHLQAAAMFLATTVGSVALISLPNQHSERRVVSASCWLVRGLGDVPHRLMRWRVGRLPRALNSGERRSPVKAFGPLTGSPRTRLALCERERLQAGTASGF